MSHIDRVWQLPNCMYLLLCLSITMQLLYNYACIPYIVICPDQGQYCLSEGKCLEQSIRCDSYTDCLGIMEGTLGSIVGTDEFEGCPDGEFPSFLNCLVSFEWLSSLKCKWWQVCISGVHFRWTVDFLQLLVTKGHASYVVWL